MVPQILIAERSEQFANNLAEHIRQRMFTPVIARTSGRSPWPSMAGLYWGAVIRIDDADSSGLDMARRLQADGQVERICFLAGPGSDRIREQAKAIPNSIVVATPTAPSMVLRTLLRVAIPHKAPLRVLLVEEDDAARQDTEVILRWAEHEVVSVPTVEEGVARAARGDFDTVVLDLRHPGEETRVQLERLRFAAPQALVLMARPNFAGAASRTLPPPPGGMVRREAALRRPVPPLDRPVPAHDAAPAARDADAAPGRAGDGVTP